MNYKIFKMKFLTNVHFGDGSLGKTKRTLYADTLFSALCHEAIKMGQSKLDRLVSLAKEEKIKLSDAFPYIDDTYYIPKPSVKDSSKKEDIVQKKYNKRLTHIPIEKIDAFLDGQLDAKKEGEKLETIGREQLIEKAAVPDGEDAMPYSIGSFRFRDACGLYFIVGYENEDDFDFISDLLIALSYTGIGGKITAGFGKFQLTMTKIPVQLQTRLQGAFQIYETLSICLPKESELEESLRWANYTVVKRGGFVASTTYTNGSAKKKKDIYLLASGAVFSEKFRGDVYDLAQQGAHPVYRYAKPLFMGVK